MDFFSLLSHFGITPERYPYLCLALLIVVGFGYIRISLGKPLSKVKDNMLVIITHLTTASRGRLNTSLIKQMSPLQIQPQGRNILRDSGFDSILSEPNNLNEFFRIIDEKNPKTRLEVESYAIFSYLEMFAKSNLLNDVKTYLYQHPDMRDIFPTLAGIDIRDRYLKLHRNITL